MKQKRKLQKLIAVMLLFTMMATLLSGCRKTTKAGTETQNQAEENETDNTSENLDENIAMGRYVEETIDLSDKISGYNSRVFKLEDGRLIITDKYGEFLVSEDNGAAWNPYQQEWLTELLNNETYILDINVGSDGTVYAVYEIKKEDESEDDPFSLYSNLMIIKPDGTQQIVECPVEEKYINTVWVSGDGRIFITVYDEPIYEVKEDGSCEPFLSFEQSSPYLIQFQGSLMIMDGYDYDGLLIYDMEKKTYIEDAVLADFINENYKNRDTNGGSYFDLYSFPGEEGVIYLAGEKGLYRHVIGGSAMEQVIDGALSTFNNPAVQIMGMIPLENNEFLALFSGGKLVRFVFDPNVPTVPTEKVKVYSLNDNSLIRQAVSAYQAENPEVFIEYEIGMEENSAITREDALKNLNTKIMTGNGPDVLVLDNMAADTYIDKGLLMDLSGILENLEGEDALFENITDSFTQDGKIYMIPCEVGLPMILGRETYTSKMKDLESMADMIEKMREDNPGKDLLSICSARGIMKMFSMASVPAWKTKDGELNRETVSDFLMQTKRIFDAQMDGLPNEITEQWDSVNEYYMQDYGIKMEDFEYFRWGLDSISYISGRTQLLSGNMSDFYAYAMNTSLDKIKGLEDARLIQMPGQSSDVFYARTIVGISAASENQRGGEEFLRLLLGKENQSSTFAGFPVNRAAFEEGCIPDETNIDENGVYGSVASSDGEGNYVEMDIYWPDEEKISQLRSQMESLSTPYIEDSLLEEAVYEEGSRYMQGEESLEEAIAAIEDKIALYMAE